MLATSSRSGRRGNDPANVPAMKLEHSSPRTSLRPLRPHLPSSTASRPVVAVIGPLPPPLHGHMVVTQRILQAARISKDFELVHVDLSQELFGEAFVEALVATWAEALA
jgi:hypothetical protein